MINGVAIRTEKTLDLNKLNIIALKETIESKKSLGYGEQLNAAQFALVMIEGVPKVTFLPK